MRNCSSKSLRKITRHTAKIIINIVLKRNGNKYIFKYAFQMFIESRIPSK